MKKIRILTILLVILLLLTGCGGKDNPTDEDLINLFSNGENTSEYFLNPVSYTEENDPNGILGKEHEYIQKIVFDDKRSSSESDYTGGTIEIFKNNQDAEIRYDYLKQTYDIQSLICEREQFWFNGEPVLKNMHLHKNGNIVMRIDSTLSLEQANNYYDVLDNYLGNTNYKQIDTVKEAEYDELYKTKVTDRKDEVENYIKNNKASYLNNVDEIVNSALSAYENDLSDENKEAVEYTINSLYKGKFYDSNRVGWLKKFEDLNTKKDELDAIYQIDVDNINNMIENAMNNPTQQNYDKIKETISSLDSNISYYKKFTNDWDSKLKDIDNRIQEIERDNNVAIIENKLAKAEKDYTVSSYEDAKSLIDAYKTNVLYKEYVSDWNNRLKDINQKIQEIERDNNVSIINNKLSKVENSLDTSLYDEVKELVNKYSSNSMYKDYVSDWKSRLKAVEADIEEKKHIEEIQEFKNSCKSLTYEELFRNSDSYKYTPLYFMGEVVQVVNQTSSGATLRVNVTRKGYYSTYYTDTIYVEYDNSDDVNVEKILEDDIIKIWGYGAGDISYTTVLGATVTIPAVLAYYIDVVH